MKYTRQLGAFLLVATAALGACRGEQKQGPDTTALGADTTLKRDLALAGRDTASQPQLKDVPANAPSTKAPSRRNEPRPTERHNAPRNAPSTSAPGNTSGGSSEAAMGTIAAGSTLNTHSNSKVCTNTNAVGDHITATLDAPVTGSNGATIPAGATVNLTVTQLKRAENTNDQVIMEFAVNSVTFSGHTYQLDATVASAAVDRIRDEPKNKDLQKVGIGAAVGAIAGKLIGKSTKATVIGGAVGAAGGAATAAATGNYIGCVASGGSIVVKLNSAATVRIA